MCAKFPHFFLKYHYLVNINNKDLFYLKNIKVSRLYTYFCAMSKQFSVLIVGNGQVGSFLKNAFEQSGVAVQAYARNPSPGWLNLQDVSKAAPTLLSLICVNDDAIALVSDLLPNLDTCMAHVSGALPLSELSTKHQRRAVFYPIMSFNKQPPIDASAIPFCIETEKEEDYLLLEEAAQILGASSQRLNSAQRASLHLAAVLSHNFGNHLIHLAQAELSKLNLDFKLLQPLMRQMLKNIEISPAKNWQTGPALRHDKKTIDKHLLLMDEPLTKAIYEMITQSIQKEHDEKL